MTDFISDLNERIEYHDKRSTDKDSDYETSDDRHVQTLKGIKTFALLGYQLKERTDGLWQFGKFIISIRKKKFRYEGRGTWYRWSTPENFIEKYFIGSENENRTK